MCNLRVHGSVGRGRRPPSHVLPAVHHAPLLKVRQKSERVKEGGERAVRLMSDEP